MDGGFQVLRVMKCVVIRWTRVYRTSILSGYGSYDRLYEIMFLGQGIEINSLTTKKLCRDRQDQGPRQLASSESPQDVG